VTPAQIIDETVIGIVDVHQASFDKAEARGCALKKYEPQIDGALAIGHLPRSAAQRHAVITVFNDSCSAPSTTFIARAAATLC
jgi:hypothetical protein